MKWDIEKDSLDSFPSLVAILDKIEHEDTEQILRYVIYRFDRQVVEVNQLETWEQKRKKACTLAEVDIASDFYDYLHEGIQNERGYEVEEAFYKVITEFFALYNDMLWEQFCTNQILFKEYQDLIRRPVDGMMGDDKVLKAAETKEKLRKASRALAKDQTTILTELTDGDSEAEDAIMLLSPEAYAEL